MPVEPFSPGANYLRIVVAYKPDAEVSETWALPDSLVTPEPALHVSDSGVISADEGDYDFAYREVEAQGWVSAEQLAVLRDEWSLDPDRAEPAMGFLGDIGDGPRYYDDERHSSDGMDWNVGGWTPVLFVDVSIIGPNAQPA